MPGTSDSVNLVDDSESEGVDGVADQGVDEEDEEDIDDDDETDAFLSRGSKRKGSGRSNKLLKDLYETVDGSTTKVRCKTCMESGQVVEGHRLSKFAKAHSIAVHAGDEHHDRAVALMSTRKSKAAKLTEDLQKRAVALSGSASTSPRVPSIVGSLSSSHQQTRITQHMRPANSATDVRKAVMEELAKVIVRKREAPSSIQDYQSLINAAANFGSQTRFVSMNLPHHKTFTEDIIEGEGGLLGRASKEVTDATGAFMTSAQESGVVLHQDSARDVNSRSVVVILASSPGGKVILGMPRPDGREKNSAWITETYLAFVDGKYDVGKQETYLTAQGRKGSADGAKERLNKIANAPGPHVWLISTDHAAVELAASKAMNETRGIVYCGDPSHAAALTANYLLEPFKDFARDIHRVVTFFRNHSDLKESLRKSAAGEGYGGFSTLTPDVETRFLSKFYMFLSVEKMLKPLRNIVNHTDFEKYLGSGDFGDEALCIQDIINDKLVGLMLRFLSAVLTPLLKLARYFDAARSCSMSFVYAMWSRLSESVLIAIAKPEFMPLVTPELVQSFQTTLLDCWQRYSFPVYDAAYALNPYFHDEVRELNMASTPASSSAERVQEVTEDDAVKEYFALKDSLKDVLRDMIRRFPHQVGARARDEVLSADHPDVQKILTNALREWDKWIQQVGGGLKYEDEEPSTRQSPGQYWRSSSYLYLRAYAGRIVDACVGSTDVERIHNLQGRIRTKVRNRLGYVRSQSLAFLHMWEGAKLAAPSSDWDVGVLLLQKFDEVTDEDELFLADFNARLKQLSEKEETEHEAAVDRGEDGDVRTEGGEQSSGAGEPTQQAGQYADVPLGRGVRRQSTSRFAAILAREVRNSGGAEHLEREDQGVDPNDEDYAE